LLEEKWKLMPDDKDMIVMQHKFEYELAGKKKEITSSMVVIGKNQVETAMAITVGMPVALATEMLLQDKIKVRGVQIPVIPELYNPLLDELEKYGIQFIEEEIDL
jgi:saccharopine dehydrogenase (NADP+, L-glutamate forming)